MRLRTLRKEPLDEKEEQVMSEKEVSSRYLVRPSKDVEHTSTGHASVARIGRSIFIKGELSGQEDLIIDGTVEGVIELHDHDLTIEQNARINAKIHVKNVVVRGEVVGEIEAVGRVEIQSMGRVQGNIFSPRVVIADTAHFKGSVDMPDRDEETANVKEQPAYAAVETGNGQAPTDLARLLEVSVGEETMRWA